MPVRFDETDWILTLDTYLRLKNTETPITENNLFIRKLASVLQERVNSARARPTDGVKNQVKVFATLDSDSPYDYKSPKEAPSGAKSVWARFAPSRTPLTEIREALRARNQRIPTESRSYWWVNQNKTYHQEIEGGYMWSPKTKNGGIYNEFYENMTSTVPGDVVFSYRKSQISDIGVVTSPARTASKPIEFDEQTNDWADSGWRVEVVWIKAPRPLRPANVLDELRGFLQEKYAPISSQTGRGNEIYLARVIPQMAHLLLRHLGVVIEDLVPSLEEFPNSNELGEEVIQRHLEQNTDIPHTERQAVIKARVGQGTFRSNLERLEVGCRVTGITDRRLLRASHIKPWSKCTSNKERVDGENGFLLSPAIDHLFDQGFITFTDEGILKLSPAIRKEDAKVLGVAQGSPVRFGPFSARQKQYLRFHRQHLFVSAQLEC